MISAIDIADALARPRPTDEQRAVIEADLTPALVVAGAGSGKTETMANRVLWLLANGHATAGQILGLTFTRKAAGELGARIRSRIAELSARGIGGEYDPFDPPVVATYNSFANTIFRDNAALLGRESDGAVLSEASAWQLARRVVVRSTDSRLPHLGRTVDTLTTDVLTLSRAMSENIVDAASVVDMSERFAELADLPLGSRYTYAKVDEAVARVGSLPALIDLAREFEEQKRLRGFVEYSDQVALALDVMRRVPAVAEEYRSRYRVVLLDEYQDTSVVQTWLLAELFASRPVMAVGDPNQSIYGWRGASAANLSDFARQFGDSAAAGSAADAGGSGGAADATSVQQFALSTSWRNGHDILAVANAIIAPLAASASHSGIRVDRLSASPTATDLKVELRFDETVLDEAETVAQWLKTNLRARVDRESGAVSRPTASMLFRTRKTQPVFIDALRRHGVPFHVLGVGGLLAEPEIADLVCALTVIDDPTAGSELVRLLAGSRWRIGVRDLDALREVASWLSRRDYAQRPLDEELRALLRSSVNDEEGTSIIDALDFVATAKPGHSALGGFSAVGLDRLRDAGHTFARLRARRGLDLLDFVTVVEQDFLLDVEVIANDTRALGGANMEALFDALTAYLAVDDAASLGGFLAWLREAEWRDDLTPRPEEPEAGTVQLMTIHGAKGLEHDLVVVPRIVTDEMPAKPKEGYTGWLGYGKLPYEFRGDADGLPVFDWRSADTRKALMSEIDSFKAEVRRHHELEERRLAYVAVTRARHALLLTGSFWATQGKIHGLSPFFVPLVEAGILPPIPETSEFEQNPYGQDPEQLVWPLDPLGSRRPLIERAAALVRGAEPGTGGPWATDLELLLEERRRHQSNASRVDLPDRVPASRFKDFVTDPSAVAAAMRRPMPERPYRATRLGTLFHNWVEQRFGAAGAGERLDASPAELDLDLDLDPVLVGLVDDSPDQVSGDQVSRTRVASDGMSSADDASPASGVDFGAADGAELLRLQETFERSPWASLRPVDVEREIHLPLDGQMIVCKIDAVFFDGSRFQVVDWKTGKAPKDAQDLEQKQLQLALYRLAYARWKGIDPDLIDAVFYYVTDDRVIAPERIFGEQELIERWRAAVAQPAVLRPSAK